MGQQSSTELRRLANTMPTLPILTGRLDRAWPNQVRFGSGTRESDYGLRVSSATEAALALCSKAPLENTDTKPAVAVVDAGVYLV